MAFDFNGITDLIRLKIKNLLHIFKLQLSINLKQKQNKKKMFFFLILKCISHLKIGPIDAQFMINLKNKFLNCVQVL